MIHLQKFGLMIDKAPARLSHWVRGIAMYIGAIMKRLYRNLSLRSGLATSASKDGAADETKTPVKRTLVNPALQGSSRVRANPSAAVFTSTFPSLQPKGMLS